MTSSSLRLAFVGDSLVNGTGDPEMLGWVGRVCAAAVARGHDVTCYNLGVRRDTSVDVAARWVAEVACRLPAEHDGRVVLSFGTNDAMRFDGSAPSARTLAALAGILEHRRVRPLLVVGPQPMADAATNERIARIGAAIGQACRAVEVPFITVFDALARDATWMGSVGAGDGAHPGADGYRRLAALVDAAPEWRNWLP